jgi:cobyrinic acid a,c-diamide synthase
VRWAVPFEAPTTPAAVPPLLKGKTIAVARDAAFCFIYPANLDTLRSLGAELVFFSPLANQPLPACDAVWLPGGYPELHAATLAVGRVCRDSVAAHVQAGRPVWAECGGMMPLFDQLTTLDGDAHAMWGLLPGGVAMQQRLVALGPQQLVLPEGSLRGHTFHYSRCESTLEPARFTEAARGSGEAVYQAGSLQASYFHAWFASSPEATASLFLAERNT